MTSSDIGTAQVEHLAKLARLSLNAAELQAVAQDMRQVLAHIDTLGQLDVSNVPDSAHGVSLEAQSRQDVVQMGLSLHKVMQNAPERLGDGFGVPKIIE